MRKRSPPHTQWLVRVPETPLGAINLFFTIRGLAALYFIGETPDLILAENPPPASLTPVITATQKELAHYFSGTRTDFSSLILNLEHATPFRLRVWQELRKITWGTTISYKELASRVGKPKGFRAVGQANGANPIPIIIPCHRVIAADGSLGGYSSGLDRKRWLLEHEGAKYFEGRPGG
ncbi:MAG: methylated-DNA--[protein]-cysteine S-methyltransferase [Deltaproteobacteria bacterium]|nr:methylated-DNA--[protein]-cysteine S-methyltransferase [Deltaproteobacteria bacterium]